jgi:hypothetical protein
MQCPPFSLRSRFYHHPSLKPPRHPAAFWMTGSLLKPHCCLCRFTPPLALIPLCSLHMLLDPHCSMCGLMPSCLHPSRASPITFTIATAPDQNPRPWPCLPPPMQAPPQTLRARQSASECVMLRGRRVFTSVPPAPIQENRVCPTHSFRPSATDQLQTLCRLPP